MGVVDEAIKDRVTEGWITDDVVPEIDGDLAGEQGRAASVAVVEDFEEIMTAGIIEGRETPVINEQELSTGDTLEEAWIGSVAAGDPDLIEQAGESGVADGEAVTTGLVAEGTSEERLARSCGSGDEEILTLVDPVRGGETEHEGAVEASCAAEVEVLDGCIDPEPGMSEQTLEAAIGAVGLLSFEEEREAIQEVEVSQIRHALLLFEGSGHTGQAEFVEQVEGGLLEHGQSPLGLGVER